MEMSWCFASDTFVVRGSQSQKTLKIGVLVEDRQLTFPLCTTGKSGLGNKSEINIDNTASAVCQQFQSFVSVYIMRSDRVLVCGQLRFGRALCRSTENWIVNGPAFASLVFRAIIALYATCHSHTRGRGCHARCRPAHLIILDIHTLMAQSSGAIGIQHLGHFNMPTGGISGHGWQALPPEPQPPIVTSKGLKQLCNLLPGRQLNIWSYV